MTLIFKLMHNSFIPNMLKEKIFLFIKYLYGSLFLCISIFIILSLTTFDISDNSFLVSSSNTMSNLMGLVGSYTASFLVYTFGDLSYLFSLFLLIYGIRVLLNKKPKYFFIRLFIYIHTMKKKVQSLAHSKRLDLRRKQRRLRSLIKKKKERLRRGSRTGLTRREIQIPKSLR